MIMLTKLKFFFIPFNKPYFAKICKIHFLICPNLMCHNHKVSLSLPHVYEVTVSLPITMLPCRYNKLFFRLLFITTKAPLVALWSESTKLICSPLSIRTQWDKIFISKTCWTSIKILIVSSCIHNWTSPMPLINPPSNSFTLEINSWLEQML